MSLLTGMLFGLLMSLPPGPSSMAVMQSALAKKFKQAFANVGSFLAADLLVLILCATVLGWLGVEGDNAFLKGAASAFLIFYGIRLYFKKNSSNSSGRNFFLTFLNPGIWMANLALVALASTTTKGEFAAYVAGIQVGACLWYALLIFILPRGGEWAQIFVKRVAPALLVVMGLYLFVS